MASTETGDGSSEETYPEVRKLLSLRKAPTETPDLTAITKLDLPGCKLSSLPDSLPDALPNLSILFLSNNDFEEVPAIIGACKSLQVSKLIVVV